MENRKTAAKANLSFSELEYCDLLGKLRLVGVQCGLCTIHFFLTWTLYALVCSASKTKLFRASRTYLEPQMMAFTGTVGSTTFEYENIYLSADMHVVG